MAIERPGRVVTFYSYKGGTGRTMSLANVAWILASNSRRVLVVDWDLEAPGLHRYFHPFLVDPELAGSTGVMDMVWEFASATLDTRGDTSPGWHRRYADVLRHTISLEHRFDGRGFIDLLPAGRQDEAYSVKVNSFDWANFYDRLGGAGFVEAMRASMIRDYDYVLIDSRTGLSDTAGICTVAFPDVLVDCFTFSTQGITGAAAVADSVRDQRTRSGRPITVWPVPMRVEDGETAKLEAARDIARARLGHLMEDLAAVERERYWGEVEVPYKTLYAYEEILAPIGDRARTRGTILAACERLCRYLTQGDVETLVPLPEEERRALLSRFERRPGPEREAPPSGGKASLVAGSRVSAEGTSSLDSEPWRIFLSYSTRDDSGGEITRLARDLDTMFQTVSGHDTTVFFAGSDLSPGDAWAESVGNALRQCDVFLPIISPSYLGSHWVAKEFGYFRDRTLARTNVGERSLSHIVPLLWRPTIGPLPLELAAFQFPPLQFEVGLRRLQISQPELYDEQIEKTALTITRLLTYSRLSPEPELPDFSAIADGFSVT